MTGQYGIYMLHLSYIRNGKVANLEFAGNVTYFDEITKFIIFQNFVVYITIIWHNSQSAT